MKRLILVLITLAAATPALAAQVADGNRAWEAGRFDDAKAAYERALAADPTSVRALYRLAVLASWRNDLDSAGVLAARARELEPGDPDVRLLQAQLAAWRGNPRATMMYDSVLAEHPGRADAWAGLARAHQWSGNLHDASAALARAVALDSTSSDVTTLAAELRRERHGSIELGTGWQTDSDENTSWWQTLGVTVPAGERLRVIATIRAQESSDPTQTADAVSLGGELGVRWWMRRLALTGAVGARLLSPDGQEVRGVATYRAAISTRTPHASIGLSFAHLPFDETARLIGSGLDLDVLEAAADITVASGLVLGLGGGAAWVSDGNDRYAVMASLTQTIGRRFFIGTYGRQMGYDFRGINYFSPGRFRLAESRAGWNYVSPRWEARVSGGLGAQQAFEGAETQIEWHAEARMGRRWTRTMIEIFGSVTNSLERSATGAYRSGAAGGRVVIGL